jgi:PQQ-dependent dehydrogenase (methanol/ethanol family)
MRKFTSKWLVAALALAVAGSAFANSGVQKLVDDPNYWAFPGGDYWNNRHSKLSQINNKNAGKLQVAWTFSTGVLRGHEGGPLVLPGSATGLDGDHLFIHSAFPNNVFAVSLDTLSISWMYQPQQDFDETVPVMCCDTVNRGLGYGDGKIYLQQADTVLVALKASDGSVVWSTKNGDPKKGETNTNAPHPIKDKVITGISGAEFGVRCWLAAYNASDGSLAWKAYSMGPDSDILFDANTTSLGKKVGKDSSLKTWCSNKDWKAPVRGPNSCKGLSDAWKTGGGSTWGWWPADFKENLVYYGNGNPSTWNPVVRPGDNKWSMTMFARDIDTGVARWAYQMTPHDEWDYDGINEMILADQKINGKTRKTVVHFNRNGFSYTVDRVSGELLVAEKFDPAVNWATHIDMKTGYPQTLDKFSTHLNGEDVVTKDLVPAALGTKNQNPCSYSPKQKLFYCGTNHVAMTYEPVSYAAGGNQYTAGQAYVNANLTMYPAGAVCPDCPNNNAAKDNMGNMIAWDATKGKIVWSIPEQWSVWSGILTTAGDVTWYGTLDGWTKVVDSNTGKLLWKHKAPSGIIGNYNNWAHKGKEYVGVLSGIGGWAGAVVAIPGLAAAPGGAALGAVGGYRALNQAVRPAGTLMVYSLP